MTDDERPRWKAMMLAWLGTFLLFVSLAHGNFETTDAAFTMHAARTLLHRGDSALRTKEQGGELLGEQRGALYIQASERAGRRINGKVGQNGYAYVWFPMGHVFLLTPFVWLGEQLEPLLQDADRRLLEANGGNRVRTNEGEPVVVQAAISMLVPSLCMATSILVLFRLAQLLGARARDAAITALAIGFATQAFSLGREQLSDGPGLMLLLLALLPVVRLHLGSRGEAAATGWAAWWAGTWSGLAVLVRYQTAFVVVAFAVVLVLTCRRCARWSDLWRFALGGAPWLVVFLMTNQLRFGDPFVTGYPDAGDWFQSPAIPGLTKILLGAGRGILWCSPILWLALPAAIAQTRLRSLAWLLLLLPLAIFSTANGWQGGQAWAIRYVTPGVVGLLALALPQTRPWRRWPKVWWALVSIGVFVNVTSVVAPVRGQIQLMSQAVTAADDQAIAAGVLDPAARTPKGAAEDLGGWQPRYSPLWRNWLYAWRACEGFEDELQRPRAGSEWALEPIYGVATIPPEAGLVPQHWADRCFRHLWWRFWGDLYGVSGWLLLLPVLLPAVLLGWFGWRRLAGGDEVASRNATTG